MEKVHRKSALKTNAIPLFNFINSSKQDNKCIQETGYIYIYIYHISNTLSNIIISIIFLIPSFSFNRPLLERMIKLNPKVYDLINWVKKNLKTQTV